MLGTRINDSSGYACWRTQEQTRPIKQVFSKLLVQVPRVAARHLPAGRVRALVRQHVETSLFGPDHVNVLALNLALDELR